MEFENLVKLIQAVSDSDRRLVHQIQIADDRGQRRADIVSQIDHQIIFALLGLAGVPLPFFQNIFAFVEL